MRFDNKVVIITGAGGGLGRSYALLFASLGAKVVVNDLGGTRQGQSSSTSAADTVVNEIKRLGGSAVANYDSVEFGEKIVKTALDSFGRVDILINNAGILRDKSLAKMTDQDWNLVLAVHLKGAYKVTRAVWPHLLAQRSGKIIMTSSAAGIYGNYGQSNYSAAKMGLHGFVLSLAREGALKNVQVNTIAPIAATRLTDDVLPKEMLDRLTPDSISPFVAFLCHDSCQENGSLFELGGGFIAKLRLERSFGALINTDSNLSPTAVKSKFDEICTFKKAKASYPNTITDVDWVQLAKQSKSEPKVNLNDSVSFKGRVAIVTGAGAGLGRQYALMLAKYGAFVIVNDLSRKDADSVVEEIKSLGSRAVASYDSVEFGEKIVDLALKSFGRLDILINNAGIIKDKSFIKMTEQEFDQVIKVHLNGTFRLTKAAWSHFVKQKFGRIVNTSSAVGLYGNFGQTNYSSAKAAIIGFSKSIALEGSKFGIKINVIAPNAGTKMTLTVMPQEVVDLLKPDYVAPFVCFLASEDCTCSGSVFEVGSGWASQVRIQRSLGFSFKDFTLEYIKANWAKVTSFEGGLYPTNPQESFSLMLESTKRLDPSKSTFDQIAKSKSSTESEASEVFAYSEKDVMLYNLGVGAKDLKFVYEKDDQFQVLPTFGVIPSFDLALKFDLKDYLPEFNQMMLLHGEQYLKIYKEIPKKGNLKNKIQLLSIQEKPSGSLVIFKTETFDQGNTLICSNEITTFIRGIKPKKTLEAAERYQFALNPFSIPNRKADKIVSEKIPENQALIYRLSGDYNPLHVDPQMAQLGNFSKPILHGLCTFGFAVRHVIEAFCDKDLIVEAVKCRFTKHVFPGETIETEMWKVDSLIIFQVKVKERNEFVLSSAAVQLKKLEYKQASRSNSLALNLKKSLESLSLEKRKFLVSKVNGTFLFTVKNLSTLEIFLIDLKSGQGSISQATADQKADISIEIAFKDFSELMAGSLKPQSAFMKGLVKVKGNMSLAMKLDQVIAALGSVSKL